MESLFRKVLAIFSLIVSGAIFAGSASAQCNAALPSAPLMHKQSWHGQQGRLMFVDSRGREDDIVGFWNIVLTSKGSSGIPDGSVLDKGLQQWHADGMEFLNCFTDSYDFARSSRIATAGKLLPSRNSRKAPPPVEM